MRDEGGGARSLDPPYQLAETHHAAESPTIAENVACVRHRMAEAAAERPRSGRSGLVAVTEYVNESLVRAVVQAGCGVLGESRPQALWEKVPRPPIWRSAGI